MKSETITHHNGATTRYFTDGMGRGKILAKYKNRQITVWYDHELSREGNHTFAADMIRHDSKEWETLS